MVQLVERRRKAFHELLDTCKAVEVDVPFAAVRDILAEDRRFARFGIDDEYVDPPPSCYP